MVASELGIDRKSVYRYLDSLGLVRNSSQANELAWDTDRFKGPDPDLSLNEQLSWLVGVLLGDGSVFKAAAKEYVVALEVVDQEFADKFEIVLSDIGLSPSRVTSHETTIGVRANSKKFYTWWNEQSENDWIEIARQYPAPFVRGIYDSEGGLYYDRNNNSFNMTISITERWILDTVKEVTESSIGHTFYGPRYYSGQNGVGKIYLCKKEQLLDFFGWIEPTISRKGVPYMEGIDGDS